MATRTRKLDPARLLELAAQGLTAEGIRAALESEGSNAGVDLVRVRLREARKEANGTTPAPKPPKAHKDSATTRRTGQLDRAAELLESLGEDLQGVLDGWGDAFSESDRAQRFQAAVDVLESVTAELADVDVSW